MWAEEMSCFPPRQGHFGLRPGATRTIQRGRTYGLDQDLLHCSRGCCQHHQKCCWRRQKLSRSGRAFASSIRSKRVPCRSPGSHHENVNRKGYYSPPLKRQVVSRMYHEAKSRGISMVRLNDMIVEDGLNRLRRRAEEKQQAAEAA